MFLGKKKFYFVAETKCYQQKLRITKLIKVKCGAAHFKNLSEIIFKKVSSFKEVSAVKYLSLQKEY